MNPVRVMIVRSTSSYGGPERQIIGFARRLDPGEFSVVVCGFSEGNPLLLAAAECGLETAVIPASKGFDTSGIRCLARLLTELGIDLVCPQDYRANVYALLAGRHAGLPVVATAHGYTKHTLRVRLYECLDRFLLCRADRIVCVSEALRRRLRRWGIPEARLCRVYNSVDVGKIGRQPPTELRDTRPIVCSVGRLSVEKGHRFLVKAWPHVLERVPQARLVLVGDGPERGKLMSLSSDLGIASFVEFVGFVDNAMDYVKSCRVFALPSVTEGLPVALLEAGAAGKPAVASNVGGVGEVVQSSRTGILIRPGRSDELAEAICWLLTHPEAAGKMGVHARQAVEAKFCYERNVPVLREVYLSALGSRRFADPLLRIAG